MTIVLSIIILIILWRLYLKISFKIKEFKYRNVAVKKYQDGWNLIQIADSQIIDEVDLEPLRNTNPDLYNEIKLRNRMLKDRVRENQRLHGWRKQYFDSKPQ